MGKEQIFSFLLTESREDAEAVSSVLPVRRDFGKYTLCTDAATPYCSASHGSVSCGIFGLAIHVIDGSSNDLAQRITEKCKTLSDLLEFEKQLGGKYLILFKIDKQYSLIGDATCSIPIFYNTEGAILCASNDHHIVRIRKYGLDPEYSHIRRNGDISQAMPYDITPYRQLKQLLPNHYLDLSRQRAVRFVNTCKPQKDISVAEATNRVLPMIQTLLGFYLQKYPIYCPITSGRDSRVVLSFLMHSKSPFSCYTIRHPEHTDSTQDLTIPVMLCDKLNIPYRTVEDVTVSGDLKRQLDQLLGEENYSPRTLRIAQTVNEYFGDGAIINGDLIGQVGKCSLHRDIPSFFATPSYFRCKLHNYSKGAKEQLKLWLAEIKESGEQVNTFDLFSIENRLGRWAGQENLMYHTIGQVYLNIFNSRSILYTWTAVNRKKRKKSLLHLELIQRTCPSLGALPFEKEESIVFRLSKINGLTYLLSSYAKFLLEKRAYQKG